MLSHYMGDKPNHGERDEEEGQPEEVVSASCCLEFLIPTEDFPPNANLSFVRQHRDETVKKMRMTYVVTWSSSFRVPCG